MKIRVTDTDRVQAALDRAQAGATEYLVDAEDVYSLARQAESKLSGLGLPEALRDGAEALLWDTKQAIPTGAATMVALRRLPVDSWCVTFIHRASYEHRGIRRRPRELTLTDEQHAYLVKHLPREYEF